MAQLGPRLRIDSAVPSGAPVLGADIHPTGNHGMATAPTEQVSPRLLSDLAEKSRGFRDEHVINCTGELIVVRAGALTADTERIRVHYGQ